MDNLVLIGVVFGGHGGELSRKEEKLLIPRLGVGDLDVERNSSSAEPING
jgi:hypothetical protein